MGARYLTDLSAVLAAAGLVVAEVDGWTTRSRSSGGYAGSAPGHVMVHHTASGPSSDGWPDVEYMTFHADAAPLCNLYLDRSGIWWVCAAGATNTNGSGTDPCHHISDDTMNTDAIGVEAGNDGRGERWPDAQLDAYVAGVRALCAAYGIPVARVHGHVEWSPTRKIDPAGPDRYAIGDDTWNLDAFRSDVAGAPPTPVPIVEADDVRYIYTPDNSRGPMIVGAGWRYWARSEHDAAVMNTLYGEPIPMTADEYDLAAAIHTAPSDPA